MYTYIYKYIRIKHVLSNCCTRMGVNYELAVGLKKGHKVSKLEKKPRLSRKKGALNKRVKFVRELIKEVLHSTRRELLNCLRSEKTRER